MENPNTHTEATRTIAEALNRHAEAQAAGAVGLSLAAWIETSLRQKGLIADPRQETVMADGIRILPEPPSRVESGVLQFGHDWPGYFIRGDNMAYFIFRAEKGLDALEAGDAEQAKAYLLHPVMGIKNDVQRFKKCLV